MCHPLYGEWKRGWKMIKSHPAYEVNHDSEVRRVGTFKNLTPDFGRIRLVNDGVRTNRMRYAISLATFFPDCVPENMDDMTVDHMDENSSNNHINNLQWMTRSENSSKSNFQQERKRHSHKVYMIRIKSMLIENVHSSIEDAAKCANVKDLKWFRMVVMMGVSVGDFYWCSEHIRTMLGEEWRTSSVLEEMLLEKGATEECARTLRVSNLGRVLCGDKVTRGRKKNAKRKYRYFRNFTVHQLVWAAFHNSDPRNTGMVICHTDDDQYMYHDEGGNMSYTNELRSLRMDTQSNNMLEYHQFKLAKRKASPTFVPLVLSKRFKNLRFTGLSGSSL